MTAHHPPHAHGETVTVSVCILHQLAVLGAIAFELMPPLSAAGLILDLDEEVLRLVDNVKRQKAAAIADGEARP